MNRGVYSWGEDGQGVYSGGMMESGYIQGVDDGQYKRGGDDRQGRIRGEDGPGANIQREVWTQGHFAHQGV